ncbi:antibiotic biosynthesis monooxygenase [Oscillatoriales cyanobacterium LEGE 11467]|uniref:Antibiotic biosynthesis monooxygenase n=1 Tax=Zarconia navalis LEGE 11467 TaxID=1828826 RepID=A0A928Z994_9CYAN|nr:antibiotic biosynthesis monooxygenase [Zarconia navalis]MBE9042400.1 antibiotic biosynthesis monooxygenase [Zarconia navalis LEGE 11467]
MPTLATNNEAIAVIIIFRVEPDRQTKLLETIAEFLETVKEQPGFISSSIHKSLDGVKVANYAQWQSVEDYEAFLNDADVQAKAAKLRTFSPPDAHTYEIFISESKVGTPQIQTGEYVVHIAEFRMSPENQPAMVELAKEHVKPAMELPELISATFHRSFDGTRVINYGHWRDSSAIEELRKQPGFGSESPYWEGIAENEFHLYEVLFTEPAT